MSLTLELKISHPLLFVGAIMYLVSMAEPYWFSGSNLESTRYYGLWKHCVTHKNAPDDCRHYDDSPSWIAVPESLICMGLSCAIGAIALSFKMLFKKTRVTSLLAMVLAAMAGILGLCATFVFFHNQKSTESKMEWCVIVNLFSDVFFIMSALFLFIHYVRWPRQDYNPMN